MAEQTTVPVVDFTDEINTHDVAELTLGRQVFNDSNKDAAPPAATPRPSAAPPSAPAPAH